MSNIETLTQQSLASARSLPGILVIDFWAPGCGPCRSMAPQFERAAELRPQYRFAKVNVDEQPTVASALVVRSTPTIVVIVDGEVVDARPGVISAKQLVAALDELAAAPFLQPWLAEGALR